MRKRIIHFVLVVALLFSVYPVTPAAAAETDELNIYAMYLGADQKGDSALLESEGHYLLVDIGAAAHAPTIIQQLKVLGVTHVDIMISHLHSDHIGASDSDITAGLKQFQASGITIDTMYLPAVTTAPYSKIYPERYSQLQNFMYQQGSGQILYLQAGDQIQFGDVTGRVLGPVNTSTVSPGQYTQCTTEESRYIMYENNCSLAVIFTCGNTKYFTAGDCYGEEAADLVATYGAALQSDIMKLCHHGVGAGNSTALLKAVNPTYSYIPNTGITTHNETTGRWRIYTAIKRAAKYGMCYLVGNEKKTLIYHIVNDSITLYQGSSVSGGKKMTGWQYLYGADGSNREHDMYYLNSNCKYYKGIRKIGSKYYRFAAGGQMDYGEYSAEGKYEGWKTYTAGERYFTLSPDGKYAYMATGFTTIKGMYMYFDENGYKLEGGDDDAIEVKKIGSGYYAIDFEGEITTGDWEEIDGCLYYFKDDGKMVRNREYRVDGEYYLFESDGTLVVGDSAAEFYEFKSDTYAVRRDGTLVSGKCAKIDGAKYYFDSKGVMQKNKLIKIGSKKFYFDKNGKMVCSRKFKLNGKTYSSNANGVVTAVK